MPTRHSKVSCLALHSDACPAIQQSRMACCFFDDVEDAAEHIVQQVFGKTHGSGHPHFMAKCCRSLSTYRESPSSPGQQACWRLQFMANLGHQVIYVAPGDHFSHVHPWCMLPGCFTSSSAMQTSSLSNT